MPAPQSETDSSSMFGALNSHLIPFLLVSLLAALILNQLPYRGERTALSRVDSQLKQEPWFSDEIRQRCSGLQGDDAVSVTAFFLKRLSPRDPLGTSACSLKTAVGSHTRFGLVTRWNFQVLVQSATQQWRRTYVTSTPTPLALLPLVLFFLALVFDVAAWNLAWVSVSFLFLLSGLGLFELITSTTRNLILLARSDLIFWGTCFIGLWVALVSSRIKDPTPEETTEQDFLRTRLLRVGVGLWNPMIFSLVSRFFYPLQNAAARLASFLELQSVVVCLSLYLLFIDQHSSLSFVGKSFLLPRYLTFAVVLFFGLNTRKKNEPRPIPIWKLEGAWRWGVGIVLVEILAFVWKEFGTSPTVFRVGVALIMSEVLALPIVYKRHFFMVAKKTVGLTVLIFLVATATVETGVRDLMMTLLIPQMHPNALAFFTFLAATGLSFVSGSFALAFFSLHTAVGAGMDIALVKAALLDGILVGTLISPFSPFNVYPALFHGASTAEVVSHRFRQLSMPIFIGTFIYAVSSMSTVAILQPVTFVFLCLVGIALRLRENRWRFEALEAT